MSKKDSPMLIGVIKHDIEHPKTDIAKPDYSANWMAYNQKEELVFVEVEAEDSKGLNKFKKDYGTNFTEMETHELENPEDWIILIGEPAPTIEQTDSLKLVKHITDWRKKQKDEVN